MERGHSCYISKYTPARLVDGSGGTINVPFSTNASTTPPTIILNNLK
ncbi:MAG: hypothetical protein FWB93_06900 [Oscillospiraceae bacterium]|nr:hypothetical protein [Oscillospiraceae bacterium]